MALNSPRNDLLICFFGDSFVRPPQPESELKAKAQPRLRQRSGCSLRVPPRKAYPGGRWRILPTVAEFRTPRISDKIFTLLEVAQPLKVADKTVYTMAQTVELLAFEVGAQLRFRLTDLEAWIDTKTRRDDDEEATK